MATEHNWVGFSAESRLLSPHVQVALRLNDKQLKNLQERLWRFSAHVRQPAKDDRSCNSTPFFDRWNTDTITSYLTDGDPRYATQDECKKIYETLLALLFEARGVPQLQPRITNAVTQILGRPFQPNSLICAHTGQSISTDDIRRAMAYTTSRLGAYEIPASYCVELDAGGRHVHDNVSWMKPLHINYALRSALHLHLAQSGASNDAINTALDKIQVKAYCTDKQTMPPYFSNRDVRWATWPASVQYASHYQCAMIEMELMSQLYEFVGAPGLDEELVSAIAEVRGRPIQPRSRQCFVTGRYLSYEDYVQAAINPKGGKSSYHVGHILPLTRGGKHSWKNIAWTSDDGNRIQGNDTLEEIEIKLVDAVEFHLRRDMEMGEPPQAFYDKVRKLRALLDDIGE
jgi:hypothetical protein